MNCKYYTERVLGWMLNNKIIVFLSLLSFCLFVSTLAMAGQKNRLSAEIDEMKVSSTVAPVTENTEETTTEALTTEGGNNEETTTVNSTIETETETTTTEIEEENTDTDNNNSNETDTPAVPGRQLGKILGYLA